ncbi:ABC transporter permease [Dyella sp. EPa41]|uniref:ABC transporter permease n=1 Tax=Dyella sp. EPa41 TaxID=1561194 RepID=UPI00191551F1|nr:ABC transporter permease [Dyella sp. EPa41]
MTSGTIGGRRAQWKGWLLAPFSFLTTYNSLTIELAKRDVLGRYRGASFGLLWSLISPFLMLMVYTFAFGNIYKGRWQEAADRHDSFAIILFIGLIVHGYFAECLNRSPLLVTSNVNFVKRVVFPLEILPWPMILSALFHMAMNMVVFIVLRLVMDHEFSWTIVFLPAVVAPLVVLTAGLAWFFAALGVYFRDIGQVTGVMSMAALFLSSAMIPMSSLPPAYQVFFNLNPLTFIINQARAVALWGEMPNWLGLFAYFCAAMTFAYAGYGWFRATRRGFADVL